MLDCKIAESLMKPLSQQPILTIFVPTYNRTPEMVQAIDSLASQVTSGLESKVEIIISDNASLPEGQAAVRALAEKYPCVSYMINAADEGGYFHLFSACWRSRGQWTWTFGSDDHLLPGGVAHVVSLLEREAPSLLTQNKRIGNRDLSEEMVTSVNGIPDRRFDNFIDLFCGVGIHQLTFISSSIERTEAARKIDPARYLEAGTLHPHLLAFFEKHQGQPCYYTSANYLVHRTHNAQLAEYMPLTFKDIGVHLPLLMMKFAQKTGAPPDFLERINGSRRIDTYLEPKITFVDNMFEYLVRAIAAEKFILRNEKFALENVLKHCRPGRLETFQSIWNDSETTRLVSDKLHERRKALDAEWLDHQLALKALSAKSILHTDKVRT